MEPAISEAQVATAREYIRRYWTRTKQFSRSSSYTLKNAAGHWGESAGLEPYVSNGALMKAALLEGYEIQQLRSRSPNARVRAYIRKKPRTAECPWPPGA